MPSAIKPHKEIINLLSKILSSFKLKLNNNGWYVLSLEFTIVNDEFLLGSPFLLKMEDCPYKQIQEAISKIGQLKAENKEANNRLENQREMMIIQENCHRARLEENKRLREALKIFAKECSDNDCVTGKNCYIQNDCLTMLAKQALQKEGE